MPSPFPLRSSPISAGFEAIQARHRFRSTLGLGLVALCVFSLFSFTFLYTRMLLPLPLVLYKPCNTNAQVFPIRSRVEGGTSGTEQTFQ